MSRDGRTARTALLFLFSVLMTACAGNGPTPPADRAKAKVPADQVVLSAAEQATGKIETQAVGTTDTPDLLRVSGRIARAADRTWRVGVRTEGLVRTVVVNL